MIGRYAVLAGSIRQDVSALDRVVEQVTEAVEALKSGTGGAAIPLAAAALNLHGFYAGVERIFLQVASGLEQSTPSGSDWHRELLRQMTVDLPGIRPPVLSAEEAHTLGEFLRFRRVVRSVYSFNLDPERAERLADNLRPVWREVGAQLLAFVVFLEGLANDT